MLPRIQQRLFCIPPTFDHVLPLNANKCDHFFPKYNVASRMFCITLTAYRTTMLIKPIILSRY